MSRGYCVKCNRNKGKGNWESVELHDERIITKDTKKGRKKILYGKCPVCGSTVTVMCGK